MLGWGTDKNLPKVKYHSIIHLKSCTKTASVVHTSPFVLKRMRTEGKRPRRCWFPFDFPNMRCGEPQFSVNMMKCLYILQPHLLQAWFWLHSVFPTECGRLQCWGQSVCSQRQWLHLLFNFSRGECVIVWCCSVHPFQYDLKFHGYREGHYTYRLGEIF